MEEKIERLFNSVIDGDQDQVETLVKELLKSSVDPQTILNQGLVAAMAEVGNRFECGEFYVPEMLIAARAMQTGMVVLKPLLMAQGVEGAGTIIIGTVKGDLHDIGKNLVAMMLEGAGFEIVDLGTDVPPEKFVDAVKQHKPKLIGMSALLTTTMVNMPATIKALQEAGLRDRVKIMVGGAPVTEDYAQQVGADGYGADASRAVQMAKRLLSE